MEETGLQRVLRDTFLSKKPPHDAGAMTFLWLAIMFAVSWAYWNSPSPESFPLVATPEAVFGKHQYWRAFTTILVHSDLDHYLSNALMYGVLSYLLYGYFGTALYPFLTLLFGTLTNLIILKTYSPFTSLVGASGVVYWMCGFWLVLYFAIDRRYSALGRGMRCLGFALATLVPTTIKPEVSYRTHAVGFALGILFGIIYFLLLKTRFREAESFEWE